MTHILTARRLTLPFAFTLITLVTAWLLAHPAAAAPSSTILVDTTDHEVPLRNNGNCTLSEAILAANTKTTVDACVAGLATNSIKLPAGTWRFLEPAQAACLGSAACALPTVTANLTLIGDGKETTILDAAGLNGRILAVDTEVTLSLVDMTLQNGSLSGADGGAVFVGVDGLLRAERVRFLDNEALLAGGAVAAADADVVLLDSAFVGNRAKNGGAIWARSVSAENSHFQTNTAASNLSGTTPAAGFGGALYAHTVALTGTQFVSHTNAFSGGALYLLGGGTIVSSTFIANQNVVDLDAVGGAIAACGRADLSIANAVFAGNYAADGTVIASLNSLAGCQPATGSAPTLTLENSRFTDNSTRDVGGGILNLSAHNAVIRESVVDGNRGSFVGGASASGGGLSAEISNALFTNNFATTADALFNYNGTLSVTQTLIEHNEMRIVTQDAGTTTLDQVTMTHNDPKANITLIFVIASGTVNLERSALVDNLFSVSNPNTSALFVASTGTATIERSVLANPLANSDTRGEPVQSGGGNVIRAASTVTPVQSDDVIGTPAAPVDAQMGSLQQLGAAAWAWGFVPLPGSPAVDRINFAGGSGGSRAASCLASDVDARGEDGSIDYDRDNLVKCDSGAHERQPDERMTHTLTQNVAQPFGATLATITLTSVQAAPSVEVVRNNVAISGQPSSSLDVHWEITPAVSGLATNNAFCYTDWEVAQAGIADESTLVIWHQVNQVWVEFGRTSIDTTANCVYQATGGAWGSPNGGLYTLAAYTAAPTAVTLTQSDSGHAASLTPLLLLFTLLCVTYCSARGFGVQKKIYASV